MSLFTFFSGSGNNAFKKQVAVINDNDGLTDTEKMAAIDTIIRDTLAVSPDSVDLVVGGDAEDTEEV